MRTGTCTCTSASASAGSMYFQNYKVAAAEQNEEEWVLIGSTDPDLNFPVVLGPYFREFDTRIIIRFVF